MVYVSAVTAEEVKTRSITTDSVLMLIGRCSTDFNLRPTSHELVFREFKEFEFSIFISKAW